MVKFYYESISFNTTITTLWVFSAVEFTASFALTAEQSRGTSEHVTTAAR